MKGAGLLIKVFFAAVGRYPATNDEKPTQIDFLLLLLVSSSRESPIRAQLSYPINVSSLDGRTKVVVPFIS